MTYPKTSAYRQKRSRQRYYKYVLRDVSKVLLSSEILYILDGNRLFEKVGYNLYEIANPARE